MSNLTIIQKRVDRLEKELAEAKDKLLNLRADKGAGRPGSARRQVYEYLLTNESTTRQLAEALNLNYLTLINRITELEDRGLIISLRKVKTSMQGLHANVWKAVKNAPQS